MISSALDPRLTENPPSKATFNFDERSNFDEKQIYTAMIKNLG